MKTYTKITAHNSDNSNRVHQVRSGKLPNGTSLQAKLNTGKANKTIRLEAEMKQVNKASDNIDFAKLRKSAKGKFF